jgi:predicted glycosyltransferase
VIGYYVHHQGKGHLHRAQALAAALDVPVTGLSSLPAPTGWRGDWVELPRDDQADHPTDVTAGDQLHWVPRHDTGLRGRTAAISAWIERAQPRLVVVDVSVEVALLVRLHGVPVVTVVLPGRRTDPAHLLGFRVSDRLVAFSPPQVRLEPGLPQELADRVVRVGAVSRFPVGAAPARTTGDRHVVVLLGQGGDAMTVAGAAALRRLAPDWRWTVLGGADGWVEDPLPLLRDADVVVTNAGQGSLADVAAVRRPAVVIPAQRPFDEQHTTASALAAGPWPALVLPAFPETGWPDLLERAAALDGSRWDRWCDGLAARRFADAVAGALDEPRPALEVAR